MDSGTLARIKVLVANGQFLISDHGLDELAEDAIFGSEAVAGVADALVLEDYPEAFKGPSILVLQHDSDGRPLHVVWGIPKGRSSPAVLATAYRPNPQHWTAAFTRRVPK